MPDLRELDRRLHVWRWRRHGDPFAFNDAYRYVDWLLTVPLLLIELVLVMRLSREETTSKAVRLGSAAALLIVLVYPGEISNDIPT